jgi:hypothetical protein
MENAAKTKSKKVRATKPADLLLAYKKYLLEHGQRPVSIYKFCIENGHTEESFYGQYASFETLEKSIFLSYLHEVKNTLESDNNYNEFSSREKLLSFYFSFIEVIKKERSLVLMLATSKMNRPELVPDYLQSFKPAFENWINGIISEGKINGEVATRPIIDKQYTGVFWLHFLFVLNFWIKDESTGFESTDAAIEKSVNLAFELIGKSPLDSMIDFVKFLYQQKK